MLIEKIKQVYKKSQKDVENIRFCKTNEDAIPYYKVDSGLLDKLNVIIDWKNSVIQKDNGDKELKPGDVFMFDGRPQVIAVVDNDTLKLVTSDTGPFALERIYNDVISPEFDLAFSRRIGKVEVDWEKSDTYPQDYEGLYKPKYEIYKIFKDRFFPGRQDWDVKDFCMKATVSGEDYFVPIDIYLTNNGIRYDNYMIPEEMIGSIVDDIFVYFYNNIQPIGRHEFDTERAEREELEKLLLTLPEDKTSAIYEIDDKTGEVTIQFCGDTIEAPSEEILKWMESIGFTRKGKSGSTYIHKSATTEVIKKFFEKLGFQEKIY